MPAQECWSADVVLKKQNRLHWEIYMEEQGEDGCLTQEEDFHYDL